MNELKLILWFFIVLGLASCSTLPNTQTIETHYGEYSYHLSGKGHPTVILESGMGDNMTSWESLIILLGTDTQVFAYNRAGFSGSKSKNEYRDGKTIVKELKGLLTSTGIEPPYILMGHSLGGLYMQLFAKTYPNEIAGIVLIDSTYHGDYPLCQNKDNSYCTDEIPNWAKLIFPDAIAGEYRDSTLTLAQSRHSEGFPAVPLVILSKGLPPNGVSETSDLRLQQIKNQNTLATLSPISTQIICVNCGHYVHQDNPELVQEALKWILDRMSYK